MTRWVGRAFGLLVLVAIVLFPAVQVGGSASGTPDSATITDYTADFVVAEDGRLSATETLAVSYPVDKHGIFRFFDLWDPNDDRVRLQPTNIVVTRDGRPEPFEVLEEGGGRYRNVKIGSAGTTLTGDHVYVIRYTVDGVLAADGDGSQFYWNLIPGGWQLPIDRSRLTVHLPARPRGVSCAIGSGSAGGCQAVADAGNGFVVTTGRLERTTPVTVRTTLPLPAPDRDRSRWPVRLDPVIGRHEIVLALLLLLAAAAAGLGERAARQTRERDPAYPLMYAPPDGLGPAQANYLLTERIDKDDFVASIMQASELGATTLQHAEDWQISSSGDQVGWGRLDPVSAYAVTSLGVQNAPFIADGSAPAGKTLKTAIAGFTTATQDWARTNKLMTRAGIGSLGGMLVIGSLGLAGFLALFNPLGISASALIPGLFGVLALELLLPGSGTKRTAAGRELWSRAGGFRRMLATPSGEQRFEFSGRKELYTAYIPWAVAFGVADEWAGKYRLETGEEPPSPHYYAGAAGYAGGSFASSLADDFSSAVSSAVSAYEATQSSSSSGGGFSGGGGGGGGGGGSW